MWLGCSTSVGDMRPTYTPEAEAYREKVQAFLAEKLPASWKGIGALDGAGDGVRIADIGLDDFHLADVTHQPHGVGQMRLAHGHPDPGAPAGQGPDDLRPDEPGTPEHGDEVWHDSKAPRLKFRGWG